MKVVLFTVRFKIFFPRIILNRWSIIYTIFMLIVLSASFTGTTFTLKFIKVIDFSQFPCPETKYNRFLN